MNNETIKLKNQIQKLIKHLEGAIDVITEEYGISQDEIDSKGKGCNLNRGNGLYGQLGEAQEGIEEAKLLVK